MISLWLHCPNMCIQHARYPNVWHHITYSMLDPEIKRLSRLNEAEYNENTFVDVYTKVKHCLNPLIYIGRNVKHEKKRFFVFPLLFRHFIMSMLDHWRCIYRMWASEGWSVSLSYAIISSRGREPSGTRLHVLDITEVSPLSLLFPAFPLF